MNILDVPARSPATVTALKQMLGLNNLDSLVAQLTQHSARAAGQVPRTLVQASVPSLVPDVNSYDMLSLTNQVTALQIQNPVSTGPILHGRRLLITVYTPLLQFITFGNQFQGVASALPAELRAGKNVYMGFMYEAPSNKWSLLAYANQL